MSGAPKRRGRTRIGTAELPLFASAMRQVDAAVDLERVEGRPEHLSTGLPSLDLAMRGGFGVGSATLVAARPKVGATSLLIGAALAALKRGERVAYFSERLPEEQLRGRFVVLESRVNGYRFRAGFVSAEDRIALAAARERIPWGNLSLVTRRSIDPRDLDAHLFSYRPWLVLTDLEVHRGLQPRDEQATSDWERLAAMARRHRVAMVVHGTLNRGQQPPDPVELPGLGASARLFSAVVLLHRQTAGDGEDTQTVGLAEARITRVNGHDVEPRLVPLRFDQRFAGLLERGR